MVADPITRRCAIIDPVLDLIRRQHDANDFRRSVVAAYRSAGAHPGMDLDTHPHADHFSAAGYLKDMTGAPTAIGDRVTEVQKIWKMAYHLPETFPTDGSQWDHLFADGEQFAVGAIEARALLSPGHTLCSMTYVIGDAAFVHDTVFMPIRERRAPIFPEATRLRSGGAFNGFSSCPTTRACYRP